jgi:hypothetical protein
MFTQLEQIHDGSLRLADDKYERAPSPFFVSGIHVS